jgi:hypothetical protein
MPLPPDQLQECLRKVGAFLEKRRPRPDIRDRLDFRFDISGSDVTLVEVRPGFQDPARMIEHPIVRARWIAKSRSWRIFWMRGLEVAPL